MCVVNFAALGSRFDLFAVEKLRIAVSGDRLEHFAEIPAYPLPTTQTDCGENCGFSSILDA
jgi:hypothetical protein